MEDHLTPDETNAQAEAFSKMWIEAEKETILKDPQPAKVTPPADASFDGWWSSLNIAGLPDTKSLALAAFEFGVQVGFARSRNYTANDSTLPDTVSD